MNDEKFDELIKYQLKQQINIPKDIEQIVTKNVQVSNSKIKILITKFFQILVSLFAICAISGGVYAATTGNSILNLLGLGKASETFETSALNINKSITNKYVRVTLNKMACDNAFLILEYDIQFTKLGLKNIELVKKGVDLGNNDIDRNSVVEDYIVDTLQLGGEIYVNGSNTENYASYTNKISNSDYKLYHIILMNNDVKDLKIQVGAYYLQYNDILINFDDTYCFYIDCSIKNSKASYATTEKQFENTKISINSVSDSDIATVAKAHLQITGLSNDKKDLTEVKFKALDESGNLINVKTHILKSIITTENDETLDMKRENDNAYVRFENGTANIDLLLLFTDGINNSKTIKLIPTRNEEDLNEGLDLSISDLSESNIELHRIILDTNYSDISRDYSVEIHDKDSVDNPYYTPNAQKISLPDFDINGLKLGMTIEQAIKNLQDSYNKANIKINCNENLGIEEAYAHYHDDYIELSFYEDYSKKIVLKNINLFDAKIWDRYGMTEKDFISSYYSEEKFQPFNQGVYEYKILYGKDNVISDFNGEDINGDFAYIFANNDRDSFIRYFSNKFNLSMSIDQTTKVITSLMLEINEY